MESADGVAMSYIAEDGSVMMQLEHSNGDLLDPDAENNASNLGSEMATPVGVKTEPEILKSAARLTQVWGDTSNGVFSETLGEAIKTPPCDDIIAPDPTTLMDTLAIANSATSRNLPGKGIFPGNGLEIHNVSAPGSQIDTSSSGTTSATPMNFPGDSGIHENTPPLCYDPDEFNADIDLNQVEYIQGDYKLEQEEYTPDDDFQESNQSYHGGDENSTEFGVKTENLCDTDGVNSAEFYIKTENLANTEETFCDIFQPGQAQAAESDSDDSSCPSVLEEFSNFPERSPPPTPEIPQILENVSSESFDSDSDDDVVCLKRKDVSETENLSETENSQSQKRRDRRVQSYNDAESTEGRMGAEHKQQRAEHTLRGTAKVLSCAEINDIKCRVPKTGKLTEILTISEFCLTGGVKRYKIFYERNTVVNATKEDHTAYILQCNNIVKQIRKVHNVLIVGEKAGEVFSGMILVEPKKPSLDSPFQMLYIWRLNAEGSELHVLDIGGLNFVIRPFRLGPFRHTHTEGENHQCALLFSESQVAKSQLSASIKHALLQIVSNQWRAEGKEKCHPVLVKDPPQKRKQRGQKRIKVAPVKPPKLVINTLSNHAAQGKSIKCVPAKKNLNRALKELLKKKVPVNQREISDLVSSYYQPQKVVNDDDDDEFVSTGTMVMRESAAEVVYTNGHGTRQRSSVLSPGCSNSAAAAGTNGNNSKSFASIASVMSGPEAQQLFSNSNSTSSEPRAEIEFTRTQPEIRFTRVKSEPVPVELSNVPRAEIEFTNIKKEPGSEVEVDDASASCGPRAEIEFTQVKSEPADTGRESRENGAEDYDDDPIAPLSEEQINIIMNQTRFNAEKSQNVPNTNVSEMTVSKKNVAASNVSSKLSASTIIKATNLLNSNIFDKAMNSSQPRSTASRHVPNILKSSHSSQSEADMVNGQVSQDQSNSTLFPTVGLHVNMPTIIDISQMPENVPANIPQPKSGSCQSSEDHSSGSPTVHHGRCRYQKSRQRIEAKGDAFLALWDKMADKTTVSSPCSSGVEEVVISETESEKSEQSGPNIAEVHSESKQAGAPKSFQSRFRRRMEKPGPMGFKTTQPRPFNPWTSRIAEMDKQTGLKILEVHSENLSAYSGDALWDKIVEKMPRSTTGSSSVVAEGSTTCSSDPIEATTTSSSGPVAAVLWKRNTTEDQWDKVISKSSNLSCSDSNVEVKLGSSVSSIKREPPNAAGSSNHSDSDSDHEGVLLHADSVPADGTNDMETGNDSNQSNPSGINLNSSFGGFANSQPITIHIPLAPTTPQPPKKKFFKSSRNTKTKFDKGRYVFSTIQKEASKYEVEFVEPEPEPKKPPSITRGARVNPSGGIFRAGTWRPPQTPALVVKPRRPPQTPAPAVKPRTYSCSLPQGGKVIRKVGIVKEIKSASTPSQYACCICGHSFKYSGDLRKHVKIHTEFRCDICKVDMPTRKIYDEHINTFHTFLSDRTKYEPKKQIPNPKYDNLERYFSYVEGENEDKNPDKDWEKCYRENGIGPQKTEPMEVVELPDDDSVHSSDSDVQDGDVFAPLANVMSGPSEDEWAKIISK